MAEAITVDLWLWQVRVPPHETARFHAVLSDDERARAARFLAPGHGAAYTCGRGRMREILGGYLGLAPQRVPLAAAAHGKPYLAGVAQAPEFNLSHTGDWAALAVTARHPLGIDIETIRPLQDGMVQRYFAPAEVAAIADLPPPARHAAFFRCWTRKEAFVKATGAGLGLPLASFVVSVEADRPAAVLAIDGRSSADVAGWRLLPLEPAPGMAGAVAIDAGAADAVVRLQRRE